MPKYKCPRDNTKFTATPCVQPGPEGDYTVVDCPTCGRGYVLNAHGQYECEADRFLVIF